MRCVATKPTREHERCALEPDAYATHGEPVAIVDDNRRVCEVCATSPLFTWNEVVPIAASGFTVPMFTAIRAARVACWRVFAIRVEPVER
jgi:hypothetical protein